MWKAAFRLEHKVIKRYFFSQFRAIKILFHCILTSSVFSVSYFENKLFDKAG